MNYKKLSNITDSFNGVETGALSEIEWLKPLRRDFNKLVPAINKVLSPYEDIIERVYYEDWFNGIPFLIISVLGEDYYMLDNFGTFCYDLSEDKIELDSQASHYKESPYMEENVAERLYDLEKDLDEKVTPLLQSLNGKWSFYRNNN